MVSQRPLQEIPRHELVAAALQLGVPRPETLTELQLKDSIRSLSEGQLPSERLGSGWFSVARHLVASVVEQGFNLPDAARVIRPSSGSAAELCQPLPTVTLARIYLGQGHTERARSVLQAVLALNPKDVTARSALTKLNTETAGGQQALPLGEQSAAVSERPTAAGETSTSAAGGDAVKQTAQALAPDKSTPEEAVQPRAHKSADGIAPSVAKPVEAKPARGEASQLQVPAAALPSALLVTVESDLPPDHWLYWERAGAGEAATQLRVSRHVPTLAGAVEQVCTLELSGAGGLLHIASAVEFSPAVSESERLAGAQAILRAALGRADADTFVVMRVASVLVFDAGTGQLYSEHPPVSYPDHAAVLERARSELSRRLG